MSEQARFLISNRREDVSAFADRFEAFCAAHAVPAAVVPAFQLALDELLTNVIDYAWPAGGMHEIEVQIVLDDDALTVEVIDDGRAFDPLIGVATPNTEASIEDRAVGGLGVHLVKQLMDELAYRREAGHNRFTMRKRFERA